MKTFSTYSFGCRVNVAEMEALESELSRHGLTSSSSSPDIHIINTCSVTHKAEREARKYINGYRKSNPSTKVYVTGCAATNWLKLNTPIEGVDKLIDNKTKEYIAELIVKGAGYDNKRADDFAPGKADIFGRSKRVMIKIQDGCHRFCSFCIVPYLRGLPVSRKTQEIVYQINTHKDFSEAILTAINTEAFGRDTGETFVGLLNSVLAETHIPRLSFGSIHPWSLTDDFLSLYKTVHQNPRFVNFFHIPLQSGSNKILNLMKRGYTREEILEKLSILAKTNPLTCIGTDVIVGFLEESDTDFEDTYTFLEESPISKFHVFRYSTRQHTAAFHLEKRLTRPSPDKMKARSKALRDLSQRKLKSFLNCHVGGHFEALMLEKREGDYQLALLENQVPAQIRTEKDFTGELKRVTIKSYQKESLVGVISN